MKLIYFLVFEEERYLSFLKYFKKDMFELLHFKTLNSWKESSLKTRPDISIIELNPKIASYESFLEISKNKNHILFFMSDNISASMTSELLLGGADDIIKLSVNSEVLRAKIISHLRRYDNSFWDFRKIKINTSGKELSLNNETMTASFLKSNKTVSLTQKEFSILSVLVSKENKIVRRENIIEYVWKEKSENINSQTLDKYIQLIREKIKDSGVKIKTCYGSGYMLSCGD